MLYVAVCTIQRFYSLKVLKGAFTTGNIKKNDALNSQLFLFGIKNMVTSFLLFYFSRIQIEGKNIGGSQSLLQLSHHVVDK